MEELNMTNMNRRGFLRRAAVASAILPASSLLISACKSGSANSCMDVSALTPAEKEMRNTLKYVDASTNPEQNCLNCQLFTPPPSGSTCGGCTLLKGPIHPKGYCTSWAKKMS